MGEARAGHTSLSTTAIYVRSVQERMLEGVRKLGANLGGQKSSLTVFGRGVRHVMVIEPSDAAQRNPAEHQIRNPWTVAALSQRFVDPSLEAHVCAVFVFLKATQLVGNIVLASYQVEIDSHPLVWKQRTSIAPRSSHVYINLLSNALSASSRLGVLVGRS